MSTKIHIKDFQSIGNVDFEVDGFTVIVGKNNIGKSAIIRAVDSVLTNKAGKEYIRKGRRQMEVKIQREGLTIDWKKGDKTTYKVNNAEFSALAGSIPKPMIDAGFDKMEIEDKKISPLIAPQFNPLFLLDKSGSVVTQVLSNLYNIDTLSEADNLCQKELKGNKNFLKTREADLKTLQDKLENFKDFESLKKQVAEIVEAEKICNRMQAEINLLIGYEDQLGTLKESVERLSAIVSINIPDSVACEKAHSDLSWLGKKEIELKILAVTVKKLQGIKKIEIPRIDEAEDTCQKLNQLETWEESFNQLSAEIEEQEKVLGSFNIDDLMALSEKVRVTWEEFEKISSLYKSFYDTATATKNVRDELKTVTEELDKAEKEKAAIKVCPTCERPF
jgi:AAA15 family ATPase/GTPase